MKSNMYKRHRIPRKQPLPFGQRMCAWLMMILLVAMILLMMGQAAEARVGIHYEAGEHPETTYQWATVNARQVNFREGPGVEYLVKEVWSWGVGVEVISVQNGWAQVLRYTQPEPMWVWAEYLDFVN